MGLDGCLDRFWGHVLRRVICGTGRVQDALCTVLTVLSELTEPKTTQSTPSSDCTDTAGITTDIPVRRQQAPQTRQEKSGGEKPIVLVPPFKPQIQSRRLVDRRRERRWERGRNRPIVAATCCILCVYPSGMHVVLHSTAQFYNMYSTDRTVLYYS